MAYITSSQPAVVARCCPAEDVPRLCVFRAWRQLFPTHQPSEREPINIDGPGQVGHDGEGRAVLEYASGSFVGRVTSS